MPARGRAPSAATQATHPAKSLMERRWQERRAALDARWAELTSSGIRERSDISGVQPTGAPTARTAGTPVPTELLRDMQKLEQKDQTLDTIPTPSPSTGPAWLRDTPQAMLIVAAVSCTVLLLLLYFGGFLG